MACKVSNSVKKTGQVFTPDYLVCQMLDYVGYVGDQILEKHIVDNSCGNGAFLQEIVRRYIFAAKEQEFDMLTLKRHLETYIHGIDIDGDICRECVSNLSSVASEYGIASVKWDIRNNDALNFTEYDCRMDYVVGNPPYVRVHNLDSTYENVKRYKFANGGMTDLYLAFFELGFNMLAENGKLCYITPSSWLNSLAASNLRRHISLCRDLISLVDLGHYQPFEGATAYTIISLFSKSYCADSFDYYVFDEVTYSRKFIDTLTYDEALLNGSVYLANRQTLAQLREIKQLEVGAQVRVKNGFATLADGVFIGDHVPESDYTIYALKASTGRWYKCLFPYDTKGKPVNLSEIYESENLRLYLENNKSILLKGRSSSCNDWYLYGRTQALADVHTTKIAINTIIKDIDSIKLNYVDKGQGVYSGLYILCDVEFEVISSILKSNEFVGYIKALKKYKSGGYYTFSSKDLEQYLNYKLANIYGTISIGQRVSQCDYTLF